MQSLAHFVEQIGPPAFAPWLFLLLFLIGSFLMLWRLEAMSASGLENTVLGTVVMPYCSGLGNLIFAFVLGRNHGASSEVMTNCLVNNVTNLTLLLGLPAIIWSLDVMPRQKGKKKKGGSEQQVNRLSLLLTMAAAIFFSTTLWALGRDGRIDFSDGLVLVGTFIFWQLFQVFDLLKSNLRQKKSLSPFLAVEFVVLLAGALAVYVSTDWLVNWISKIPAGFISAKNIGWLSGWLMVVPNGILAFYYAWTRRPEITYSSQIGDGHICIPLCLGLFSLFSPIQVPTFFHAGIIMVVAAAILHFLCVASLGRLPRPMGIALTVGYCVFLYYGLAGK